MSPSPSPTAGIHGTALITADLLSSNPRGFARWFEQRATLGRRRSLSENRLKAAIEDVPPYDWKTTLQQSIQILKRHRDVMFDETPELAPISMIITNLAANAYDGESDALDGTLQHHSEDAELRAARIMAARTQSCRSARRLRRQVGQERGT